MAREKIFKFKQFSVRNDLSAMKVGTDGVLLGAWCDPSGASRILDVGTGTGLVALMIAQRSHAAIEAIDIDSLAVKEAGENFNNSPWKDRLSVIQVDFNNFIRKTNEKYDLIISNPPYFENSLKCPDDSRTFARHASSLNLDSLIGGAKSILSQNGRIVIIYPSEYIDEIRKIAVSNSLQISKICFVKPMPEYDAKRVIVELTDIDYITCKETELIIEKARGDYHTDYIGLTKEYYLKF